MSTDVKSHEKEKVEKVEEKELSKNQLKKQKKRERFEETKKEWREKKRLKEKEKKKEKQEYYKNHPEERPPKPAKIEQKLPKFNIAIDMSFDDLMLPQEIKSLSSQISRCYSANRKILQPVNLHVCSLNGGSKESLLKSYPTHDKWTTMSFSSESYTSLFPKDKIVYLTADSENTIDKLNEDAVYIIGGIVDRNRHKSLCFDKANKEGISTARLPIGEYLKLSGSKVLTVHQVFEILLQVIDCDGDWGKAFEKVIPKRKVENNEETPVS